MKLTAFFILALTLLTAASSEAATKPLKVGDEIQSSTADCETFAVDAAAADYDLKNPECMFADAQNSQVSVQGNNVSVVLMIWGGGGHASCGGAQGDGVDFTILPSRSGCRLRVEAFTWN